MLNFLGKIDNAASEEAPKAEVKEEIKPEPQPEPVQEEKKEVYRVVDSDIVRPDPVKVELPIWLL